MTDNRGDRFCSALAMALGYYGGMATLDNANPYATATIEEESIEPEDVPLFEPPESVTFRYTAELLAAFWTDRTLHSEQDNQRRLLVSRRIGLFAGLLAIVGCVLFLPSGPEGLLGWIGLTAWVVGVLAVVNIARRILSPQAVYETMVQAANGYLQEMPNVQLLSPRTVTLEATGVRVQTPHSQSFTLWAAYERFAKHDEAFYLYDSGLSGVVVPRTAFSTRARYRAFAALADRLWNEARVGSPESGEK